MDPGLRRDDVSGVTKSDQINHHAPSGYACIYHKNKNGMGGIATSEDGTHVFKISAQYEMFALHKDEVVVIPIKGAESDAGIIQAISRHHTLTLTGFIQKHKDKLLLRVSDHKFGNYLVIIKSTPKQVDRDQLYNTTIVSYPSKSQPYFEVELTNLVAVSTEDDQHFMQQLLIDNKIPIEFSAAAIAQSNKIDETISNTEIKKRQDLRDLAFVTIDGADAKDFDDAVYCDSQDGIFNLYVAIADVAQFVTTDSALDHDAYERGTSIYFPKRVIPMLPEKLSNGVCSLKPNVDRLAMCCQMQIDPSGKIINYTVYNAVINSKARLTYNQAQDWLNDLELTPEPLISNISNLFLVYQALQNGRANRGAIDFDSVEPIFIFDEHGLVSELQSRVRLESHKLIEECMLAANVCVADYLIVHCQPGLFRIHPKPSEEKFTALKSYLNSIAVPFDVKHTNLEPHHYSALLERVKTHPSYATIQQAVLRSMQLAIYSPDNIGHFGLSYDRYLHFTSPIRRYPDLLVHRAVKSTILKGTYNYAHALDIMGEQTSFTERRAEELGRKVDAYYKCQYAGMHIGKIFTGISTSIVSFGIFIYIPELMLDGLLHVTSLGQDYYIFDAGRQVLVGKNTGVKYKAGQEFTIEIASVDMARLFIDFKLVTTSSIER